MKGLLALCLVVMAAAVVPSTVEAQDPCPSLSQPNAEAGWTAYRSDNMREADARFAAALAQCDNDEYARTGLGYVRLRAGAVAAAEDLFARVLTSEPNNVDALIGSGLAQWRLSDLDASRQRFERALTLAPDEPTAVEFLERIDVREARTGVGSNDEADAAWRAGDSGRAFDLYADRLETEPADAVALQRLGLMHAWRGEYDPALELFSRLMEIEPDNLDARVDLARVLAWAGEVEGALAGVEAVLDEDPQNARALEARALFLAWAGRYEEALSDFDRVLQINPGQQDVLLQQARVRAWATDFTASLSAYDRMLGDNPDDAEARLGRARVLSVAGRLDEAIAEYDLILSGDPTDLGAQREKARALAWAGRLDEAERLLRGAVEVDPESAESWVGLGRVHRWQRRLGAASDALHRASELAPTDPEVREELRQLDDALAPVARPTVAYESDSDGNRMVTATLGQSWTPTPRARVRVDGYRRDLEQGGLANTAVGAVVTTSFEVDPGLTIAAALGGSRSGATGGGGAFMWRGLVRSPSHRAVRVGLEVSSRALDETALLNERGVRQTGITTTLRWRPDPSWLMDLESGYTSFEGTNDNTRWHATLALSRRMNQATSLGVSYRSFGFDQDLTDGYFDPDLYWVAEANLAVRASALPWSLTLEAAPGLQQVGEGGSRSFSARGSARVGYLLRQGREFFSAFGYASSGLLNFSTGSTDYRYRSWVTGFDWTY